MSQRKGANAAKHFTAMGETFDITPELSFLMEATYIWKNITDEVRNINRGTNRRSELSSEIDKLMEMMLGLQVLLKGK